MGGFGSDDRDVVDDRGMKGFVVGNQWISRGGRDDYLGGGRDGATLTISE